MMKFIFLILFLNFMFVNNKMLVFYYNIFYLVSFMMIFMYMFKDYLWININMSLSCDYYSFWLIILSFWILSLMMMCFDKMEISKMMILFILIMSLMVFFLSMDMLLFYLMFEISLIPTFFLIIYWGSNPERVSAAYYMMIYMLMISFPLLVYLFNMYMFSYSMKFSVMKLVMESYMIGFWGFIMIYMAFFIKMPVYMFHIWLPKAHVEAPVYGSMILAGVLLKMGSYGLIRFMEMLYKVSIKYNFLIISVSIIGSGLISIMCMIQIDMKSLVAYSSVVHMNMMLSSLMTFYKVGFISSYIMMIAHGLCSSGLFYMVNLYYTRSLSRILFLNKGMLSMLPSFSMWWFLLCSSNFSFPFSVNFLSELYILMSLMSWDFFLFMYLFMICFFSSAYSLYLFSYIQHGVGIYAENKIYFSLGKELMVLILHFYPIIMFLLNLSMFM